MTLLAVKNNLVPFQPKPLKPPNIVRVTATTIIEIDFSIVVLDNNAVCHGTRISSFLKISNQNQVLSVRLRQNLSTTHELKVNNDQRLFNIGKIEMSRQEFYDIKVQKCSSGFRQSPQGRYISEVLCLDEGVQFLACHFYLFAYH